MAKSLLVPNITTHSVRSISPWTITDPRLSYTISTVKNQSSPPSNGPQILQYRMHIILYYNKPHGINNYEEHCGWHVGGWVKEVFSRAMVEVGQPVLAGRLRWSGDGLGRLELVANDSGVRCVEKRSALSLTEFLESQDKYEVEGKLVYWQDIDDDMDFQFCPLVSIQITNFQCGGYSIGISHSLLIDPLQMTRVLHKWAQLHQTMAYEGEIPIIPLFYTPKFKPIGPFPQSLTNTTSTKGNNMPKTILYNFSIDENLDILSSDICKSLVLHCIEEVENENIGHKMSSRFALIIKNNNGDIEIEEVCKQDLCRSTKWLGYKLHGSSWDVLKTMELGFQRGNVPFDVSYWVDCRDYSLGVVLVVISSLDEGVSCINIYIIFSSE